jgi:hypothetical protein
MHANLIFLPALLQILVTLVAYLLLRVTRDKASNAGLVNEARRGLHDDAWPESVLQVNNNIRNQFELPVLFYVLVMFLWALGSTGLFVQIIAWLFSLSRVVHLYIHTGSNYVPLRRKVFTFGLAMVVVLFGSATYALLSSNSPNPSFNGTPHGAR